MDLREYQRRALETDQVPGMEERSILVPLLGLAGEAGTLVSEYKKYLRDGEAHRLHRERVAEELGDLLWYLSNVATKYGLDLNAVAAANLDKTHRRWTLRGCIEGTLGAAPCFDGAYPPHEQLPRQFEVEVTQHREGDAVKVQAFVAGRAVGDPLTDNAYGADGYRFHDIFHFAYAAVLGWSPVTRWLLRRKRKSNASVDEVEDGGRAIAIEEGLAAIIFNYAQAHSHLEGVTAVDEPLLKIIKGVTSHLEVSRCSEGEWETAVLLGFEVWRQVATRGSGHISIDLDTRSMAVGELEPAPPREGTSLTIQQRTP